MRARTELNPGGLSQRRVTAWTERLRALGGTPADESMLRCNAVRVREFYGFSDTARTLADDFEGRIFVRRLAVMAGASCTLRSPITPIWDERPARRRPDWVADDAVVVGTLLGVADSPLYVTRYADAPLRGSSHPLEQAELVIPVALLGKRRVLTEGSDIASRFLGSVLARATAAFVARFAACAATGDSGAGDSGKGPDPDEERAAVELIVDALAGLAGSKALKARLGDNPVLIREAALAVIERRYSDPKFDVESIAAELYVSRRHLYRAFEGADQSLAGLIAERRIESATAAIRAAPYLRLSDLAGRCGFASADTFRSRFRAIVGISPSDYRALEQHRRTVN